MTPSTALTKSTERYRSIRSFSQHLCSPLVEEDYVVQTMSDVSPTKWHLAHTTWFFENFLLIPFDVSYRAYHPQYSFLFNSYYNAMGTRHCRAERGFLSRPTVKEVYAYREHVDRAMEKWLERGEGEEREEGWRHILEVGLHHEQQHQELMVTDIKHVFACNPLNPVYSPQEATVSTRSAGPLEWIEGRGGLQEIGYDGSGFCYDNELARHTVYLQDFRMASRLVTCGEYIDFIEDGAYDTAELWLSDGWNCVQKNQWKMPLYWRKDEDVYLVMTLGGLRPVRANEPVCHVSYYEAEAFARWSGARLPTEFEWEMVARTLSPAGHFADSGIFHPLPADGGGGIQQCFGDVWEWTSSGYLPYPGYRPEKGALGEYNGKFMCNQMVLRGGSCATSATHIRPTYRNFFYPESRWQFSGIRLGRDA